MKSQGYIQTRNLRIKNLSPKWLRRADPDIDDLQPGINYNWEYKARRLQARRWRKLKQQLV